jgi:hypothetical protein
MSPVVSARVWRERDPETRPATYWVARVVYDDGSVISTMRRSQRDAIADLEAHLEAIGQLDWRRRVSA